MPLPGALSATSAAALDVSAFATPARFAADALGDAGSKSALNRLNAAVAELKAVAVQPLLQSAINALNAEDHQDGAKWALQVLEQDERNGLAWYLLAIAREKAGDFRGSIACYESALKLLPDHAEIANNLGRLAYRMGQKDVAEKLFRHFLARHPGNHEGANNLACVMRDLGRFDEAIDVLKAVLTEQPERTMVWNTLGSVLAEQGDAANARIFFDEALRLDPSFSKARYNRSNMHLALGDAEQALVDCEEALTGVLAESDRQMMLMARSTIKIALGRVAEGWDDYEARFHPQFADYLQFMTERPRWEPGADLAGKSFLVIAEQGLGDEILFANTLPDILEALGPDGHLTLAVERRLVPMFQRAFPTATVGRHVTYLAEGRSYRALPDIDEAAMAAIDLWAPIGSLLRQYRRTVEAYPDRDHYMEADPERVAYWRGVLESAPAGKKVGLLWKSAVKTGARHRFYSAFAQWEPVLTTPGVTFVNLQYGDCDEEIAYAKAAFGVDIWTPPGIDLKQDLDDVAALCCAMDLVIGFSNATLNIAAACGVPTWLISTPGAWTRVGTDRYPWYPQVQVFLPPAFGDWEPAMDQVAAALADFA
jgi:tetratricopeptide (TPR) repeat protein